MKIAFVIGLLLLTFSCDSASVKNIELTDQSYIVHIDTVFVLGETIETIVEVYSSKDIEITFEINDSTYLLLDNGKFRNNGDFLFGDHVYSAKIDLTDINTLPLVSHTLRLGSETYSGAFQFLVNNSFLSIVKSAVYPVNISDGEDSIRLSMQVDSEKYTENSISTIFYSKLNGSGNSVWEQALYTDDLETYQVTLPSVDFSFGSKDSSLVEFAYKIDSPLKSELVYKHFIRIRNKKPVFVSDSIYPTQLISGKRVLPVEISVSNFEGLTEISQVFLLSSGSGSKIPLFNDGVTANDKTLNDDIWRVELDVTGATGNFTLKGFIEDLGGNKSDEFSINFDL